MPPPYSEEVGSAAAWAALAGDERRKTVDGFCQASVKVLRLRFIGGDWLGLRPVIVDGVRWDGTNVFNEHHDNILYMVPTGGRIALKRSLVAMVEPTAFEI